MKKLNKWGDCGHYSNLQGSLSVGKRIGIRKQVTKMILCT